MPGVTTPWNTPNIWQIDEVGPTVPVETVQIRTNAAHDDDWMEVHMYVIASGSGSRQNGQPGDVGMVVKINDHQLGHALVEASDGGRQTFSGVASSKAFKIKGKAMRVTISPLSGTSFDSSDHFSLIVHIMDIIPGK